jgi:hypothetical protein
MSNTLDGMDAAGTLNRMAMANLGDCTQSSQALARRRAVGFAAILADTTDAGAGVDTSTSTAARQSSATGQVLATVTTPAAAVALPVANSPFEAAAIAGAQERALAAAKQPATQQPAVATAAAQVTSQSAVPTQHWYGADAADDAYWAKQPAAIQQLREIEDPDDRKAQAIELAGKGYSIDVPIMVWGFDAGKTTALRQQYGYTWVPSAMQNPVELAPGLSFPGMQSYDPNNPPAGSIMV